MVSRNLGKPLRTNGVQKSFNQSFKDQKYTKFNQNCPKMTTSNFCCIGRKIWDKNDCKLNKNLRNYSFYQK